MELEYTMEQNRSREINREVIRTIHGLDAEMVRIVKHLQDLKAIHGLDAETELSNIYLQKSIEK